MKLVLQPPLVPLYFAYYGRGDTHLPYGHVDTMPGLRSRRQSALIRRPLAALILDYECFEMKPKSA